MVGYIITGAVCFMLGIGVGVYAHWRHEMKGIARLWGW